MRILIIEDEIIIARFIENEMKEGFQADTRIALGVNEALAAIEDFVPQLVLCDIELNDQVDGIDLVHKLRMQRGFELVFITSYQSRNMINRAYDLNPANYIIKPLDENRLYAGVLPVIKKIRLTAFPDAIATDQPDTFKVSLTNLLNPTETMVLQLIAQKKTTKEIAEALYLSPYTIKNYRHGICRKLDLSEENNALLKWALENYTAICQEVRQ